MMRRQPIDPDRPGYVVQTLAFPETERRWSAILSLSLIDGRLVDWKALTYVFSMPPGFEAYRFKPSDLEGSLPELACRSKTRAGAWIKATRGRYERS